MTVAKNDAVAIVVVNYRTAGLALRCVEALAGESNSLPRLEIVVVDGGSGDGSVEELRRGLEASALTDRTTLLPCALNGGFGWANNQAILRLMQRDDPPDFIHLLNPDASIESGAVTQLVEFMHRHPRAAAAGSQLIESDGSLAGSAFRFPTVGREFIRGANTPLLGRLLGISPMLIVESEAKQVDWVTGASVMLRVSALRETGLFDTGFFLYYEEVELMHRMHRTGWEIWHVPSSRVVHIGGAATGIEGGSVEVLKPLPAYWFASRRRFFALTGNAFAAGVAWLLGNVVWRLRQVVGLGRVGSDAPHERHDLLRHGMNADSFDRRPAVVRWNDPLDQPPAWSR